LHYNRISIALQSHYNSISTKLDIIWEGNAIWEVEGKEVEVISISPDVAVIRVGGYKEIVNPSLLEES